MNELVKKKYKSQIYLRNLNRLWAQHASVAL